MQNMNKIFYAAIILLLCISCSKDNDRNIDALPEAKISLLLKASKTNKENAVKPTAAKAGTDANELAGEANINNITAFVFNQDGSELLATPYYTDNITASDGIVTIANIPAKAAMAQIILIANAGSNAFGSVATYSDLESVLCKLDDQSQTSLAMSTQVIETTKPLVVGDENYLGYTSMGENNINNISTPLELTRLAARLDVINVRTNFTAPEFRGRTVTIESISIANRKTASRYFSRDYWGEVMVADNLDNSETIAFNLEVNNETTLAEVLLSNYVMENDGSEAPTELLIKATLSARSPYQAETRVFGAVINERGSTAYGHNNIKRNYVYKIALSFGDNSFEGKQEPVDPDPTPDPDPDPEPEPEPEPDPDPVYGLVNLFLSVAEWNTETIDVPDLDN